MAGSCRENCPLILLCENQQAIARGMSEDLTTKFFNKLDDIKGTSDQLTFTQLDEEDGTVDVIEELTGEVGDVVARVRSRIDDNSKCVSEIAEEAISRCGGLELQHGGRYGGLILKCGGMPPTSIEALASIQRRLGAIGKLVEQIE